mmetsp:Transcript_102045/g.329173  ORF Transcript_102045/g.329173 Transcript_102045/m.329173 type:complete len:200 (-) Transcript_102045:39-638(-)
MVLGPLATQRHEADPRRAMRKSGHVTRSSGILTPAILLAHLSLLLGREVVDDVELLADLLGVLPLDHRRDLRAREIQQALDIQVIGCQDQLKEHLLLDVDVLGVPLGDSTLDEVGALERLLNFLGRVVLVVLAVVDDLAQDSGLHVGQRDLLVGAAVVNHVFDERGHAGDLRLDLEDLALGALELQHLAIARHGDRWKL